MRFTTTFMVLGWGFWIAILAADPPVVTKPPVGPAPAETPTTEPVSAANSGTAAALVEKVVAAAGGREQLLKLFRIKEHLVVDADLSKPTKERISVLQPPHHWWMNRRDRVVQDQEPANYLVWVWTLGALVAPETKLEVLPDIQEENTTAFGLRLSGSITPALDVYFNHADYRLWRIDWRSDIHRFSDWRQHDGVWYPAKCIGYKKKTGKPWYASQIVELERLTTVPAEFMPKPAADTAPAPNSGPNPASVPASKPDKTPTN